MPSNNALRYEGKFDIINNQSRVPEAEQPKRQQPQQHRQKRPGPIVHEGWAPRGAHETR